MIIGGENYKIYRDGMVRGAELKINAKFYQGIKNTSCM